MTVTVKKVPPKLLRDELAIEAMRSLLPAHGPNTDAEIGVVASLAYRIADAMLDARLPKPTKDDEPEESKAT